jgi:hypothetical protein
VRSSSGGEIFVCPRRSFWLICALFAALAAVGCALGGIPPSRSKDSPTPPAPALSLSSQTLAWGNVTTGSSATQSELAFNFGTAPLLISQVAVTGKGFALSGEFNSLAVEAGHTASLEVTFTSTVAGSSTGMLSFATNDPANPAVKISLSATAVAPATPEVLVSPASLAFGDVAVGAQGTAALSIKNTGTANLAVNSLTTTGKGFTVIGPATSAEIVPGASINVQVILAPSHTGAASGTVLITTNASASPVVIPLTGTAVAAAPILSVTSTSVSFGNVLLGALGSRTVTLSNSGTANLLISQLTIGGSAFHVSGLATPATLVPAQSATITISFAPILAVLMNGSLVISSNSVAGASQSISLSGSGISVLGPSVTLSWSPSVTPNIAGYNIYRSSVSGGPYSLISGPIAGTTFTDTNVTPGQTYYYVLTSVTSGGVESGFSGQAAVTVASQ